LWFIHPETAISKNRNGSSTLCVFKTHYRYRRAAVAKRRIFMQIQFSDHTGYQSALPILQQIETQTPVYCHPKDVHNVVTTSHVARAGQLHAALAAIPRNNPIWEALRSCWAALTMYSADRRYPFFWMALESLFGANDATEIGYKLAQRISFFLADTSETARDLFRKIKTCYKTRSTIIHGRWKEDPKIDEVMAATEAIIRGVFQELFANPEMVKTFISTQRDQFLEDWVFSRKTDPPPYPKSLSSTTKT
jgi:hypothetical protein